MPWETILSPSHTESILACTKQINKMKEKLIINKKPLKGEDGYKTFSIRIKDKTVTDLDALSKETNRSRNELINILLDYAIENCEVK